MNRFKDLLEKRWFSYTFALCSAVLFFAVLMNLPAIAGGVGSLFKVLSPVFVGVVSAYLLDPIATFFEKNFFGNTKIGRIIGVIFSIVIVFGAMYILVVWVVPSFIESVSVITNSIPYYQRVIYDYIDQNSGYFMELFNGLFDQDRIEKTISSAFTMVQNFARNNVPKLVNTSISVGGALTNFVIGLIIALYLLLGKAHLMGGIDKLRHALFTDDEYENHSVFLRRCHKILITFIYANLLDSIIVGVLNAVILTLLKIPFVPLVSVIAGVTNIIPTFGPVIGLVIGGIVLVLNKPLYLLIFAIVTLVVQTLDGYVIKPKLYGSLLGVPSVWILISIIVGGKLFGIMGILLAIPFAAIVTFVYKEVWLPRLSEMTRKREGKKVVKSTEPVKKED